MFKKNISSILIFGYISSVSIHSETLDSSYLKGSWHIRIMDGMEVRKARAILDFDIENKKILGFDACNRLETDINIVNNYIYSNQLKVTHMACRQEIHKWVRKRLHKTLKEGFSINKNKKNDIEGIALKSKSHTLFLKKMGLKPPNKNIDLTTDEIE